MFTVPGNNFEQTGTEGSAGLALALFIPMKGKLPADTIFKYLLLYLSQILFLCPYENYRGLLTSLGYTKCVPINMLMELYSD